MRKTIDYTVTDEGRDRGKVFRITEMSATQGEKWAARALLALMAGGVDLPEGFDRMGMAGMAEVGIRALSGLRWEVAEPLLDEMWQCVQIVPDPLKPQIVRPTFEEDIEEIATRVKLRLEVWKLHTGFFQAVAPSVSGEKAPAKKSSRNA